MQGGDDAALHSSPGLKSPRSSSTPISRTTPSPNLALCPPPTRLHHPLHQIRRHHQLRVPVGVVIYSAQCLIEGPPPVRGPGVTLAHAGGVL
jgi:hypothetical protein